MTTRKYTTRDSCCHPFRVGEAVCLYSFAKNKTDYRPYYPAVITRVGEKTITIQFPDGRKRVSNHHLLVYRGYCEACALPAAQQGAQLVCSECGQPARDEFPPIPMLERWLTPVLMFNAIAIREIEVHGRTHDEAYNAWATWSHDRNQKETDADRRYQASIWQLGLRVLEHMRSADDEDIDDAIDDAIDELRITAKSRPVYLDLPRPADDSEPDGADDTTRWLERQFKRAA